MANYQEELNQLFLKYPRLRGLACTLFGLVIGCWTVLFPVQQAESGVNTIYISVKLIFLAELNLLFGLPVLIFGDSCKNVFKIFKVFKRLPSDRQKTMTFHYTIIHTCIGVITAIMLAMLIFTDSFIKGWLESKRYTMR